MAADLDAARVSPLVATGAVGMDEPARWEAVFRVPIRSATFHRLTPSPRTTRSPPMLTTQARCTRCDEPCFSGASRDVTFTKEFIASGVSLVCVAVRLAALSCQWTLQTLATAASISACEGRRFSAAACFQTLVIASAEASRAPPVRPRHLSKRLRTSNNSGEMLTGWPIVRNQRLNSLSGSTNSGCVTPAQSQPHRFFCFFRLRGGRSHNFHFQRSAEDIFVLKTKIRLRVEVVDDAPRNGARSRSATSRSAAFNVDVPDKRQSPFQFSTPRSLHPRSFSSEYPTSERTAARPKGGRPLQNPTQTRQHSFGKRQ